MDFLTLVNQRQSIRKYSDQSVEKNKIEKCLEAARLAPSASNSQPWHFIVVDDAKLKNKIAQETYDNILTFNKFVQQAPVLIVIVIEKPKLITQIGAALVRREFPLIDIGIAAEHFCLQATEMGLGTCMVGWFKQKNIKKLLNIPKNKTLGLIITLGYPPKDITLKEKKRKNKENIISYNSYR